MKQNYAKFASFILITFLMTICFNIKTDAQAVEVEPTFNPSVTKDVTSNVTGNISLQTDGKILIYGTFQTGGTYLNRLNTDGTNDTTFNCAICATINIYSAAALPDGKIAIAGFTDIPRAYRLNADGSLDSSFNANLTLQGASSYSEVEIEAVQPDGKIFIRRLYRAGLLTNAIHRLNIDGGIDISFTPITFSGNLLQINYAKLLVLSDGKIMLGSTGFQGSTTICGLNRLNSNGSSDATFEIPTFSNSFDNQCSIQDIGVTADGKILVAGKFTLVNSISKSDLVRLFPAGNVDLGFSPDSLFAPTDVYASKIRILPDGKILVNAISYNSFNQTYNLLRVYRLNSDGSNDLTFNTPPQPQFVAFLDVDSQNRAVFFTLNPGSNLYGRYNADGSLDASFNPNLVKSGIVTSLAVQPDSNILISGDFNRVNGIIKNNFARVNPDGTIDPTFDSGTGFDIAPSRITVQPDGKILAVGAFTTYNGTPKTRIARLNFDGSLDTAFNPLFDSTVNWVVALPDGKILVGGLFTTVNGTNQSKIARLNSDGSLDTAFNPVINSGEVYTIILQSNGQIMIGGSFSGVNGFNRTNFVRLNADGTLDSTFNAGSITNITKIIQQTDGKYLVLQPGFSSTPTIVRRNADGTADTSFQTITINGTIREIFLQTNGRILVGGTFFVPKQNIARYNSNGTVDSTFLSVGANNTVNAIVGQTNGKILIGGNFVTVNNVLRSGLARISAVPVKVPFDYDGDGKADVSVFRPSENKWYVLKSSDSSVIQQVFAISGDVPVPADYDGDRKTDIAIFRSTGDWWSLSSSNNSQVTANLGTSTDIKLPSDFDGDGRADYIIFRPSNNFWYRLSSATGASSNKQFGAAGDKPVIGDFDGDGKSDVAIFRPSTGDWWWQSSVDNVQRATRWGIASDIPTPADFDGDGKTDFAVYRPSTGVWYIYNSSTGNATIMAFGLAEDKPIAADYDGDGKADIAVFRPSTGIWYLMRSTAGFTALQFGISTDIPTQNSFVP